MICLGLLLCLCVAPDDPTWVEPDGTVIVQLQGDWVLVDDAPGDDGQTVTVENPEYGGVR